MEEQKPEVLGETVEMQVVEPPKQEPKKKGKGATIVIILLLLIIIGLGGFIAYDKFFNNDKKENKEPTPTTEPTNNPNPTSDPEQSEKLKGLETEKSTLDVSSEQVVKLYKNVFISDHSNNDSNIYSFIPDNLEFDYHKNYALETNKMKNKDKLWLLINNIKPFGGKILLSDLEKEYHKLFGNDSKFEFEDFSITTADDFSLFINNKNSNVKKVAYEDTKILAYVDTSKENNYNSDKKILADLVLCQIYLDGDYVVIERGYEGNGDRPNQYTTLTKATKSDNFIYIYEKVLYRKDGKLYSDKDYKEYIADINDVDDSDYIKKEFNKNNDYLDTYRYVFKSNNDGSYYFYGVEKYEQGKKGPNPDSNAVVYNKENTETTDNNEKTVFINNNETKTVKLGDKERTISIQANHLSVDGKEIADGTLNGIRAAVIFGKILVSEEGRLTFYDSNLNKIEVNIDKDIYPAYYRVSSDVSKVLEEKNNKIIIQGRNETGLSAGCITIDDEYLCSICDNGKILDQYKDKVIGKLIYAEYEVTYDNNQLSFKRIVGSEEYADEYYCN